MNFLHKLFYCVVCAWGITIVIYTIVDISIDIKVDFHIFFGCLLLGALLLLCSIDRLALMSSSMGTRSGHGGAAESSAEEKAPLIALTTQAVH